MAIRKLGKIKKENGEIVLERPGYGYSVPVLAVSKHFVAVLVSNYNRIDIERKSWDTNKTFGSGAGTIYMNKSGSKRTHQVQTQCTIAELKEVTNLIMKL